MSTTGCQQFLDTSKHSVSMAFMNYLNIQGTIEKDPWYKGIAKCTALIVTIPFAVIEGIVRGIFALLATVVILFFPEGKARDWYNEHIFSPLAIGSLISFSACPFGIGTLGLGVGTLIFNLAGTCAKPSTDYPRIAKMPPSVWCCCTPKTTPNPA